MEIFTVILTIATFCNNANPEDLRNRQCKGYLIDCLAPKEGAKISFKKVSACFKEQAK